MGTDIHPTAIIEKGARLGQGVKIDAYAYIGAHAIIGDNCHIHHHATVDGHTEMGIGNIIHPYAYIGGKTQDLKYRGGITRLTIGDHNDIREFSTLHTATHDGGTTRIGSHNHFLAYTHIAHDCIVGDHVIISNNGTLAGHVIVEDHAIIGGLSAVHQFCRIGSYAMLGGCCKIVQDVIPFVIADGSPAATRSINKIGLERNGFSQEEIQVVRKNYKILFKQGNNMSQALEKLKLMTPKNSITQKMITFIEKSTRGITTA